MKDWTSTQRWNVVRPCKVPFVAPEGSATLDVVPASEFDSHA